jgi:sulfur carrier protein ThiS
MIFVESIGRGWYNPGPKTRKSERSMADHIQSPVPSTKHAAEKPVTLVYRRETFAVRPGMTVRQAVVKCGLNPETVLAVRDGALITDEVVLNAGDTVRLIATISGG